MKGKLNFLQVEFCAAAGKWYVYHPYISAIREIDNDVTGRKMLHAAAENSWRIFMTYITCNFHLLN